MSIEDITDWLSPESNVTTSQPNHVTPPCAPNSSGRYASNLELLGDVAVQELKKQSPVKRPGDPIDLQDLNNMSKKQKTCDVETDDSGCDATVDTCRIVLSDGTCVNVNASIPSSLMGLADSLENLEQLQPEN